MKKITKKPNNKNARGSSAQFFVAGELCRRDLVAGLLIGVRLSPSDHKC